MSTGEAPIPEVHAVAVHMGEEPMACPGLDGIPREQRPVVEVFDDMIHGGQAVDVECITR